jgi:hypothetical protein
MTQFGLSSANNDHLSKSHQKATNILGANEVKTSLGLNSKVFYGNTAANVKSQLPVKYIQ